MKIIPFSIAVITGTLLILLDLYRASHLSFIHDESYSFLSYVPMNIMDIISYKDNFTNNHIINSLLMKLFNFLLGPTELSLRLPNVLAHILYLFFCYKLAARFCGRNALLAFLLLNANPYMLEFFSLARGYGLSFAFMSGGFYFFCSYLEKQRTKDHVLSLTFFGLAALANFALIQVFPAVLLLHNFFHFVVDRNPFSLNSFLRTNRLNLIVTVVLAAILYEPVRKIIQYNRIDFGGVTGFWHDTVSSLLEGSAYQSAYGNAFVTAGRIIILLVVALFMYRAFVYFRSAQPLNFEQKLSLFSGLLLLLVVSFSLLQHWLMGTPYVMQRYSLFFFPLFMWMFIFLFSELQETDARPSARLAIIILPLFLCVHTYRSLNASWYLEWQYDQNTRTALYKIREDAEVSGNTTQPLRVSCSWMFEPSMRYYLQTEPVPFIEKADKKLEETNGDYLYIFEEDSVEIKDFRQRYAVVQRFNNSGSAIYKRRDIHISH